METVNWYGMYSLTKREIKRFMRVYNQTIFAPVVSAMIFLSIFVLAIGSNKHEIAGIKFINFMGYGLIIMSVIQNTFSNSSSSIIMSKVIGYIIDILYPPLGSVEIIIAYTVGSLARGILVGIAVTICLLPFVEFTIYHPVLLILFILLSCIFLGQAGILVGITCQSFDHVSAITSYIVVPLSFLSGTFYSVKNLPIFMQYINILNPFFYMIDGFRYSLTNHADSHILFGLSFLLFLNISTFMLLYHLINIGWRIKG